MPGLDTLTPDLFAVAAGTTGLIVNTGNVNVLYQAAGAGGPTISRTVFDGVLAPGGSLPVFASQYVLAAAAGAQAELMPAAGVPVALLASQIPSLMPAGVLAKQGNSPYWLQTSGTVLYALVTNDRVLKSYDISTPQTPVLIATSALFAGTSQAYLQVRGSNVYVTDSGALTMTVLDATSLAVVGGPVVYSSGGTGGGRFDVDATGTFAVIGGPETGANANKAAVMNVSVRTLPVLSGTVAASGTVHRGVAWLGGTKWAVASRDTATVYIVDTATPSAPTVVTSFSTHGTVTTPLLCVGTTLYVGNYGTTGVFEAWDVSTPAAPVFESQVVYAVGGGSEQIAVRGSVAYIAARATNQLAAVNVSNPSSLSLLSTVAAQGSATTTPGVATDPSGAYVYQTAAGDTTNGQIMVIATPSSLSLLVTALQAQISSAGTNSNRDGQFGDGSDGVAVLDGTATVTWASLAGSTYTMTRSCQLLALTVNSGVTLKPAGCQIYVAGAFANAGTIFADGNAAALGVAGAATTSAGVLGLGQAGGAGNTGAGSAGSNSSGGIAGNGGAGGAGSGGAAGAAGSGIGGVAGQVILKQPAVASTGTFGFGGSTRQLNGGAGGGGGGGDATNKGGGGGGGGGLIVAFAFAFANTGTLTAQGGAGAAGVAGNSGGGGGGGGGLIVVYALSSWTQGGTINTNGGALGAGVGTGATGVVGGTGNALNVVLK